MTDHLQPVENAFTVDLEDWYQGVEIDQENWAAFSNRLEIGTERLLDLLAEASTSATFFILGYAANQDPGLIRNIAAAGHEIATHGYGHRLVYQIDPETFRDDLQHSIEIIQDITGVAVRGHRAPFFSITEQTDWAFPILRDCGIEFDSSVFPIQNYRYGIPDAPRWIYRTRSGVTEFPLTTDRLGDRNIPMAGGAYFRIYPYFITAFSLRRINAAGHSAVFYVHPWELDPDHPRLALPQRIGLTHYWNLESTAVRVRQLLRDFRFTSMGEILKNLDLESMARATKDSPLHGSFSTDPL